MLGWGGLSAAMIEQIEQQHGRSEATALVDLLQWSLDPDPVHRPGSMAEVLDHAFFNLEKGSLREDFAVQRLRELVPGFRFQAAGRARGSRAQLCPAAAAAYAAIKAAEIPQSILRRIAADNGLRGQDFAQAVRLYKTHRSIKA